MSRAGRPRKAASDTRDRVAAVRLTKTEHAELTEIAQRAGLPISTYLRRLALGQLAEHSDVADFRRQLAELSLRVDALDGSAP